MDKGLRSLNDDGKDITKEDTKYSDPRWGFIAFMSLLLGLCILSISPLAGLCAICIGLLRIQLVTNQLTKLTGFKLTEGRKTILTVILLILLFLLVAGYRTENKTVPFSTTTVRVITTTTYIPPIEKIRVNPCIGMPIPLSSIAGSAEEGAYAVGFIPDCSNIEVDVLERKCNREGWLEFDKIRYGSNIGWATRRLLTCPANVNCYGAKDSICPEELEEIKYGEELEKLRNG